MKSIFPCEINGKLTIHNAVFEYLNSNMFVVVENHNALVIDPHKNRAVYHFLRENKVNNITILLTHEHSDHTSGIQWLKNHFENVLLIATKATSDYLADIKNARPLLINLLLAEQDKANGTQLSQKFNNEFEPFCGTADIVFEGHLNYTWEGHALEFFQTVGHSLGSCCILLDDCVLFTGDSLMKEYPILTRLPRGSKKDFQNLTIPFFEGLNKDLKIFPGHGAVFELGDLFVNGKLNVEFR